jgi:hypothetical protein
MDNLEDIRGQEYLATPEKLRDNSPPGNVFSSIDCHYNELVHKWLAQKLYEKLNEMLEGREE